MTRLTLTVALAGALVATALGQITARDIQRVRAERYAVAASSLWTASEPALPEWHFVVPVQFVDRDTPGFGEISTYGFSTDGRQFFALPYTIGGGRSALPNLDFLSWGYGALVARETLFDDVGGMSLASLSFGGGAWFSVTLGSMREVQFVGGGALRTYVNSERPTSNAFEFWFGLRRGVG